MYWCVGRYRKYTNTEITEKNTEILDCLILATSIISNQRPVYNSRYAGQVFLMSNQMVNILLQDKL